MEKVKKSTYILLFLVVVGFIVLIIKYFSPYYTIESRINDIKKYKGYDGTKAIGWLKVQGTNIDFPIVYYYDTDVTDPTNDLGWSFIREDEMNRKITLFSHNVLNVSSNPIIADKNHHRFEQLMSFIYPSFVEKNKYIQYTVNGKDHLYKIYGISFQKENTVDTEKSDYTNQEIAEYIEKTRKKSYFKFDTDVVETDDLLTLVTCTRFFGSTTEYSFVVDARRVRDKEKIKNYGITEKKSYNRIKEIMEGEKKDEEV